MAENVTGSVLTITFSWGNGATYLEAAGCDSSPPGSTEAAGSGLSSDSLEWCDCISMELWQLPWGSFSRGFLEGFEEERLSPALEREVRGRNADQATAWLSV